MSYVPGAGHDNSFHNSQTSLFSDGPCISSGIAREQPVICSVLSWRMRASALGSGTTLEIFVSAGALWQDWDDYSTYLA